MTQYQITDEHWTNYLRVDATESHEEKLKRAKVVLLLEQTIPNFGRAVAKEIGYKKGPITMKLSKFGSYALGGYIRHADIDLVLLCPQVVKRVDFNRILPALLKQQATIEDVTIIRRANVPIIKCVVDSISIDISFVRLREPKISPNINLLDDNLLHDIDPLDLASMDGPRTNQFIREQIRRIDIPVFQACLQCVKYWATHRQIYNKPVGYLNGSTWTFLMLKTYQLVKHNDQLTITYLLKAFFDTWMDWPWPTPVLLTEHIPGKNGTRIEYSSLNEFRNAVMPIVSPCYPVSLATPYVTKSTLKIMTREFKRASFILHSEAEPLTVIRKLFNPANYFKRYPHYLCIVTSTQTSSSYDIWLRKMAVFIPQFVTMIESCPDLTYIQPVIKPKTILKNYRTVEEKKALQSGLSEANAQAMDHTGILQPGTLYLSYHFIGLGIKDSCTFIDLSESVDNFMSFLESKRNKNDDDVQWVVNTMNKLQVAELLGIKTQ